MTGLGFTKESRTMSERQANENQRNCRWSVKEEPDTEEQEAGGERQDARRQHGRPCPPPPGETPEPAARDTSSKSVPLVVTKFDRWIASPVGPSPAVNATT